LQSLFGLGYLRTSGSVAVNVYDWRRYRLAVHLGGGLGWGDSLQLLRDEGLLGCWFLRVDLLHLDLRVESCIDDVAQLGLVEIVGLVEFL
jgi:hypothetical protein